MATAKEEALSALQAAAGILASVENTPAVRIAQLRGVIDHAMWSVLAIHEVQRPGRRAKEPVMVSGTINPIKMTTGETG